MYHSMLTKVTQVIKQTVGRKEVPGERDEMYDYLFRPDAYVQTQEAKRARERRTQNLIAGVTIAAAVGEAVHLARRSGIINKVLKK